MLRAVGRDEEQLGARVDGLVAVQEQRTQARTELRAARLERLDDVDALGAQPRDETRDLGRLTAPLPAPESDEQPAGRHAMAPAVPSVRARRMRRRAAHAETM